MKCKRKKAEEKLRIIKDQSLISLSRVYNGKTWLEAAENSHSEERFHRIIDTSAVANEYIKSILDDLDDDDFKFTTEYQRKSTSLAYAAKALLINAEKVTLFDPYICSTNIGSMNVLNQLMLYCYKSDVEFYIFSDEDRKPSWNERKDKLVEIVKTMPKNIKLYWYSVNDNGSGLMHKRGLFTSKGGLIYDRGFQEPRDIDQQKLFTDIAPMPLQMFEADSQLYNSSTNHENFRIVYQWCSHS